MLLNLKVSKNTLPDKSGNPESLKKESQCFESFSTSVCHSWWRFAECVLQVVLFTILWFKWPVKKHCVAKVLQAIWEIVLDENNCNYNYYRCSYKFAFIGFLSFLKNQKQESRFQQAESNGKYFYFLFTASYTQLQSHAEFNRLL